VDEVAELERKQFAKLLALERKQLLHQKHVSDTWVRYLYLLLEHTNAHCAREQVDFRSLSGPEQSKMLQDAANSLRAKCGLPSCDVVCEPADAELIVSRLAAQDPATNMSPVEALAVKLQDKYGSLLQTVPVSIVRYFSVVGYLWTFPVMKQRPSKR
jgi:hypothetical protein